MIGHIAALLVFTVLVAIALLHIHWGVGGIWPAPSGEALLETVVGERSRGPRKRSMPGVAACFIVAALLLVAGALPLMVRDLLPVVVPASLASFGLWMATGVLALRGLGGFFERRLRPGIVGLRYDRLNRVFYSPLCLVLATLLIASTLLP